jgi:hypothetical protein
VIESDETSMHGLRLSPFSPLHHVGIPSLLMNLDATVLTAATPKSMKSVLLNRSISTAVSSPRSTPSLTPKNAASSQAARGACLIAALIRSWRGNSGTMRVVHVTKTSDCRPLVIVRRRSFDDCLLIVGGIAVYIGAIDVDWINRDAFAELDTSFEEYIVLADLYTKVMAAAKSSLSCFNDVPCSSEILALAGYSPNDMTLLLSAAIVLNDIRDNMQCTPNDYHVGFSRSVSQMVNLATVQ